MLVLGCWSPVSLPTVASDKRQRTTSQLLPFSSRQSSIQPPGSPSCSHYRLWKTSRGCWTKVSCRSGRLPRGWVSAGARWAQSRADGAEYMARSQAPTLWSRQTPARRNAARNVVTRCQCRVWFVGRGDTEIGSGNWPRRADVATGRVCYRSSRRPVVAHRAVVAWRSENRQLQLVLASRTIGKSNSALPTVCRGGVFPSRRLANSQRLLLVRRYEQLSCLILVWFSRRR